MNIAAIGTLLQLVATLLTGVQHNTQLSQAGTEQTIMVASRAIQISDQAMAKINFSVPANDSIWPDAVDVRNAPYLDAEGNYVQLGTAGVSLIEADTSFGDLNNDGYDDAAVVVQKIGVNGGASFALAAMLNQGGILFNIADISLGNTVQIYSHHVVQGGAIVLNMENATGQAVTSTYELLGNQLIIEN